MPATHTPFLDRSAVDEAVREWAVESGQRLKDCRRALGWTQVTLAQLTDTTPETVCRIELGAITPREPLRLALAYSVQREVSEIWPPLTRKHIHRVAAETTPPAVAAS